MDTREHLARQAAGFFDDIVEAHERGETVSPVDTAIARATLGAAFQAGIHPADLAPHRRTAPFRD